VGAVADAAGDAQGQFQGLFVVEARVDGGAVVAVEVGGDEVSRAAEALGDVLAGELDVHAAEAGAGRFVQLEGELELSERLRAALDSGLLRLEDLTTDGAIPIATHDMPVRQGRQAGRRIVLELALRLTLPAGALEDDSSTPTRRKSNRPGPGQAPTRWCSTRERQRSRRCGSARAGWRSS